MTSLKDFERPDGSVDWDRYRQSQLDDGALCCACGATIVFSRGVRSRCVPCQDLEEPAALDHPRLVRCPRCTRTFNVLRDLCDDAPNLLEPGEHLIVCGGCDHEFEISTHVCYTFSSPERDETD